jgi:hypothetical protein
MRLRKFNDYFQSHNLIFIIQSCTHLTEYTFPLAASYRETLGVNLFSPLAITRSAPDAVDVQYIEPESCPGVKVFICGLQGEPH